MEDLHWDIEKKMQRSLAMMSDIELKEANSLAGLFQSIVADCKGSLPLFDILVTKSSSLQSQLHSTISVFSSFLDTVQKIADSASATKGSSTDLGICLTRIVIRHRAVQDHVKTLASSLFHCLSVPLQSKKEEWRRTVVQMDKDHSKQFKKMRTLMKKKSESMVKVERKLKKNRNKPELVQIRNNLACDLQQESKRLCEKERLCVREIGCMERTMYTTFAAGLKPVIGEEFAMLKEVEQLGEVLGKVNKIILDPYKDNEHYDGVKSFVNSNKQSFCFATPPSTPGGSTMGSRSSSIKSMNSFSRASSSAGSVNEDLDSYRSRNNSVSSQQSHQLYNRHHKRNSTISNKSKDSGFASQDLSLVKHGSRIQEHNSPLVHVPVKDSFNQYAPTTHYQVQATSFPLPPSTNLVHTIPPSPHLSRVTSLPPVPPKSRPTIPVRRSSLDRQHATNLTTTSHYCRPKNTHRTQHVVGRGNNSQGKEEVADYEDIKTPTNERITIVEGKSESVSSSGSSYSSNSSGYTSQASQRMALTPNIKVDPESPDQSRTLKRTPRNLFSTPQCLNTHLALSSPTTIRPAHISQADIIRSLTDRLSCNM